MSEFDVEEIRNALQTAQKNADDNEYDRIESELRELRRANKDNNDALIKDIARRNGLSKNQFTWQQALDILYDDSYCPKLAACFAKEEDWDSGNGTLKDEYLRKYVLGALYNAMKRRKKKGFSAESYGIFQTCYPQLEGLNIPLEVKALNNELTALWKDPIGDKDWQNYLKIYLDFNVRTNEYLFFKGSGDWDKLDIEDCRNLKSTYGLRRSVKDPKYKDNKHPSLHYKLLWRLFGCDDEKQLASINPNLPSLVDNVVKAMWVSLTDNNIQLLVTGQRYYKALGDHDKDWHNDVLSPQAKAEHRENKRLNVASISFCLFDGAYREENVKAILDTTFKGNTPYQEDYKKNVKAILDTTFKGNTPYQEDYKKNPVLPLNSWNPPYPSDEGTLNNYYDDNQVSYLKCKRVEDLYNQKPIFIQYEHTAQVHKDMARQRIEEFKDHDINILACSTTMEMGVDIGELEIVSMSNIPPHPANYKQRAGRAGRAFQNKSTCVTICNSDAVGTAVLKEPKEALLEREVMTPSAGLNSPQVVQRHINSFLLREFFVQIVTGNHVMAQRNIQSFEVIDFFLDSNFDFKPARRYHGSWRVLIFNNTANSYTDYYPKGYDVNTFHNNSLYTEFRDWLVGLDDSNTQIWEDLNLLKSGTALSEVKNSELISSTDRAIKELFSHLSHELEQMKSVAENPNINWDNNNLSKYAQRLNYDFVGLLRQKLLIYCSTHQFTPNANMPVNIIELKIRDDKKSFDNPSRDLVVALSEYAPGKSVTIDGKNYTIGGVDWDREAQKKRIHICTDCGYTWDSLADTDCPLCRNNNIKRYDFIVPTAFLPEQETDRIVDKVSDNISLDAQLIGTNGLTLQPLTHLCDYDVELPQVNTKILYLNKGIGKGYCICQKAGCGRAVLESQDKKAGDTQYVRELMYSKVERYDKRTKQTIVTYEHQNLQNYELQDEFDPQANDLLRNMFIGGSISTNFSILKPYHCCRLGNGRIPFRMSNATDEAILKTLGLLVCEELSNDIPCQRQDIGFLITTLKKGERALCIYDTAKGGAGYSSHLDEKVWPRMLDRCLQRLEDIVNGTKGIDSMFTRSTMRYLEEVDIKATYEWLNEENNTRDPIPSVISNVYRNAVRSSLIDIKDGLDQAHTATLFIQPDNKKWNYELDNASVPSWKETRNDFKLRGNHRTELAFCGDPGIIPAEASDIIKHSEDWVSFAIADSVGNGIYPLAYIDGWLYITDDATIADFNGLWGRGKLFAVQVPKPQVNPFTPVLTGFTELFIETGTTLQSSKGLLDLIMHLDGSQKIQQFIDSARGHQLEFCYMDEHLKNQLGIIMIIQFINEFANKVGCDVTEFNIVFKNEEFYDRHGMLYSDNYRKLTDSFQSDADVEEMINDLLTNSYWNYIIDTKPHNSLPHWRSLIIKDKTIGATLTIKPHGGIANGWFIDTAETRSRGVFYRSDNSNSESDIPLISDNIKEIQYTISLTNN